MQILYDIGITQEEIKNMMEQIGDISKILRENLEEKIKILEFIGCSKNHIKNIVVANPRYLLRENSDILRLIAKLKEFGVGAINLLFDSNPFLLNKDDFEIEEYINEKLSNGELLEDIVDDIESNPYVIDEI